MASGIIKAVASKASLNQTNQNVGILDDRIDQVEENVGGDVYDPLLGTYEKDALCVHDNKIYRCITPVLAPEPFDSTKWTQTSLEREIKRYSFNGSVSSLDDIPANGFSRVTLPASISPTGVATTVNIMSAGKYAARSMICAVSNELYRNVRFESNGWQGWEKATDDKFALALPNNTTVTLKFEANTTFMALAIGAANAASNRGMWFVGQQSSTNGTYVTEIKAASGITVTAGVTVNRISFKKENTSLGTLVLIPISTGQASTHRLPEITVL